MPQILKNLDSKQGGEINDSFEPAFSFRGHPG